MNLPYHIAIHHISSEEGCRVDLVPLGKPGIMGWTMFNRGLTPDIVDFLVTNGRCYCCDKALASDLAKCECDQRPEYFISENTHLSIRYPYELCYATIYPILDRAKKRDVGYKRSDFIKKNGGTHTEREVLDLLEIQEGRCYFCGQHFQEGPKGKKFHVDHYHPIRDGGRSDVKNLVLACPACNMDKGASDGDWFDFLSQKTRAPEVKTKLQEIRRRLNSYKKKARKPL